MGLVIGEHENNKNCIPSYLPDHGEFKNLCFISVAQTVWVLCAFVNGAVDVNKIVLFFSKPAFIHIRAIDYTAKIIAFFICQSLVNILS